MPATEAGPGAPDGGDGDGGDDLTLRQAGPDDLPAVARVHLASRQAAEAAGWLPPGVHPPDEVTAWVRGWDLAEQEVWLADLAGHRGPVGYARFTDTWLDDLYVVPDAQRRGVGAALLGLVQALRPSGLGLWVFESNRPGRDFYARHGFVVTRRTDGSGNEEGAPDLALTWPLPVSETATRAAYDDSGLEGPTASRPDGSPGVA